MLLLKQQHETLIHRSSEEAGSECLPAGKAEKSAARSLCLLPSVHARCVLSPSHGCPIGMPAWSGPPARCHSMPTGTGSRRGELGDVRECVAALGGKFHWEQAGSRLQVPSFCIGTSLVQPDALLTECLAVGGTQRCQVANLPHMPA